MEDRVFGLKAFSYTWNLERDKHSSNLAAFGRALKAVVQGVELNLADIYGMNERHPKSLFARNIQTSRVYQNLVLTDKTTTSSTAPVSISHINQDGQTLIGTPKPASPDSVERYLGAPELEEVSLLELCEFNVDSDETDDNKAFYRNFHQYIYLTDDLSVWAIWGELFTVPLENMKKKGMEAVNFKLTGLGGTVKEKKGSSVVARQFVEVILDNGHSFLMYRSSGISSKGTDGEWVPIPGWGLKKDPFFGTKIWFIKLRLDADLKRLKQEKYDVPIFNKIHSHLKEKETSLFPELKKDDASVDDSAKVAEPSLAEIKTENKDK
ncbi:hypothetical protein [Endozoicomonas sp. ONNA2]|uniref:hypothetical protein n=1 Tax=Endozoicomonas sp. ONNA2 TaxID=2828741 RepID=UPI0021483B6E|nr:hypothetical protein [Endozoicomonas sp. ONNA2]